ncbi:PDZ and LIM domain protein 2 [Elysia marginata]|uniref:PDZ and LIM domain protein 2 n=1 Tax=Elysia marginata TaxID=1093978 RepID=A0AAV4J5H6_9GAST|nr:PDZ and LIM domain protein 2 [Elysia marginata]
METYVSEMETEEIHEYMRYTNKVRLSNGTLDAQNDSQIDFPSSRTRRFSCAVGIPEDCGVSVERISSLTHPDQQQKQQDTVELSLEGLQSSGQSAMSEDQENCSRGESDVGYGSMSQDIAAGITSASEKLTDEKEIPHGVSDGVFEIAPLKLQVSETKRACPAVEDAIKQGRQPFEVVLRGGGLWGFALDGGASTGLPVYISKIVENGKCSESALMEGDYILQINSQPCDNVGQAFDIVDTATDTLTLQVLR